MNAKILPIGKRNAITVSPNPANMFTSRTSLNVAFPLNIFCAKYRAIEIVANVIMVAKKALICVNIFISVIISL